MWHLIYGSVTLFRAYEIFGDEKYLEAGLERADVFLRDQVPRGNWRLLRRLRLPLHAI